MSDILLVSGSLRGRSSNSALLRTAETLIPAGFRGVPYLGIGDLPHFNPDDDHDPLPEAVVDLRKQIDSAAALLICTPEYAGALPGSFKNLLDWTVGGIEIGDKPTAWINVSANATNAANAHASLRLVLNYTGAAIVEEGCVHLPVIPTMIDSGGIITDVAVREGIVGTLVALSQRVLVAGSPATPRDEV
ncbi:NADPH-dependent FMN reductase [Rhodococcus tibetensis]|uniref:NAD(P)H-dependent oxidoreductase n=1 Tax=Rhodococcus tibetensis TaxID=2965064 RepID=A0ABT1QHX0_9NOCA|nr:NADPH-dependent FMN reductase [Rhodococcus sp. FXJ9.536]MCQ4120702.1 NAD(P)H-dependent oxidoreductase [Rhodococcus sp. FXJ9.536]